MKKTLWLSIALVVNDTFLTPLKAANEPKVYLLLFHNEDIGDQSDLHFFISQESVDQLSNIYLLQKISVNTINGGVNIWNGILDRWINEDHTIVENNITIQFPRNISAYTREQLQDFFSLPYEDYTKTEEHVIGGDIGPMPDSDFQGFQNKWNGKKPIITFTIDDGQLLCQEVTHKKYFNYENNQDILDQVQSHHQNYNTMVVMPSLNPDDNIIPAIELPDDSNEQNIDTSQPTHENDDTQPLDDIDSQEDDDPNNDADHNDPQEEDHAIHSMKLSYRQKPLLILFGTFFIVTTLLFLFYPHRKKKKRTRKILLIPPKVLLTNPNTSPTTDAPQSLQP